ncbi:MAG TPA: alpha/beta hydrolase [Candidatus Hydrogenedentes bacterium]|nr:alpha/beta hydrolase [Candidatus Hydrogenedentota bacterium]
MLKKILKIAAGVVLILVVLLWGFKAYRDAHYFDNYEPKAPLNITVLEKTEVNKETPEEGYVLTKFTFDAYQGEKVPTLMSIPLKRTGKKLPVVLFLHGIGQNKNFLKEITLPFNQTGFAFVSADQFMQGERKLQSKASFLEEARAFMQRPAKTINEARRLIDYLSENPDIDPQRIYLVGASYGAITGTTVMAKDKRIRAGVLVYGGADLGKLLNSTAAHLGIASGLGWVHGKINPEEPPLPKLTPRQDRIASMIVSCVVPIARYFLGAADPIHYADKIAPTPVYFQNGKFDVLVPATAGEALQQAAKDPKKITWYNSDHVGIDLQNTIQVLKDGLGWLLEQDNPLRPPEEQVKEVPDFNVERT